MLSMTVSMKEKNDERTKVDNRMHGQKIEEGTEKQHHGFPP